MKDDNHNICNSDTFENLYKFFAKDVRRFLFFKTQDIDRAEDLMQDAFIKLWDNCNKVNYAKVKSYLFTVANNLFLNEIKHNNVVTNFKRITQKQENIQTPEFIMIEKEFMDKLNKTIANLPDKQREVFLLNRIEKKKYKEIAAQLNISIKAVEKRMHQAILVMRKEIGNI